MGERVKFKSNGNEAQGYLARAAGTGPAIVVIQEWWGLVPHIERIADRFAEAGFVALAPDLYHGRTTKSPDEAGKLMMSLRIDEAAREIAGAIAWLASQPGVKGTKVGVSVTNFTPTRTRITRFSTTRGLRSTIRPRPLMPGRRHSRFSVGN